MGGAGLVDFTNATLSLRSSTSRTMKVHADTSDFRLTEGDTASIAFRTDNVNATIKLDERMGEFVSNGSETKVEFPYNQYICYMDRSSGTWTRAIWKCRATAPPPREARTCSFRAATSSAPARPGLAQLHGAQGALRFEKTHHYGQRGAVHPGGRCADHHRTARGCGSGATPRWTRSRTPWSRPTS
jgi:hypothetical protein